MIICLFVYEAIEFRCVRVQVHMWMSEDHSGAGSAPPPLCGFWELNLVPAALGRAALYFLHVIDMDIINASSNSLPHIADSAWQSWSHHCWQTTLR